MKVIHNNIVPSVFLFYLFYLKKITVNVNKTFPKIPKMQHMRLRKLILCIMLDNIRQMKEGNKKSVLTKVELIKIVATF